MKTTIKAIITAMITAIVILILSSSITYLCLQDKINNCNTAISIIDKYVDTYNTDNVAISKIITMSADAELFSEFGVNNINATVEQQELKDMIEKNFLSNFYRCSAIVLVVLLIFYSIIKLRLIVFFRC